MGGKAGRLTWARAHTTLSRGGARSLTDRSGRLSRRAAQRAHTNHKRSIVKAINRPVGLRAVDSLPEVSKITTRFAVNPQQTEK